MKPIKNISAHIQNRMTSASKTQSTTTLSSNVHAGSQVKKTLVIQINFGKLNLSMEQPRSTKFNFPRNGGEIG